MNGVFSTAAMLRLSGARRQATGSQPLQAIGELAGNIRGAV